MVFRHLLLLLPLSFTLTGCSGSDNEEEQTQDDTPNQPSGGEEFQFSEPDLAANSAVAQLSFPAARDLTRELITGAYLDQYFSIDSSIRELLVDGIGGQDAFQSGEIPEGEFQAPFACPEGGSVSVSHTDRNGPLGVFTGAFTDCMLEGNTLSGTLTRTQKSGVTGGGGYLHVTVNFDQMKISNDQDGTLTLSGSATRNSSTSTAEMLLPGERGSCELVEDNSSSTASSALQTARLERPGVAGSVIVTESTFERTDRRNYDATSDQPTCPLNRETDESGNAVLTFEAYGPPLLEGMGSATTLVDTDVVADERTHVATQQIDLPDGSSVAVTALSSADCTAQIDITADGAAFAFVDDFCFVADDFQ